MPRHICTLTSFKCCIVFWCYGTAGGKQAKRTKYRHLDASHHFVLVAVEISGVLGSEALQLLRDLGHRLREAIGKQRSYQFLLQRVSVAVRGGNRVAVVGSLRDLDLGLEGF